MNFTSRNSPKFSCEYWRKVPSNVARVMMKVKVSLCSREKQPLWNVPRAFAKTKAYPTNKGETKPLSRGLSVLKWGSKITQLQPPVVFLSHLCVLMLSHVWLCNPTDYSPKAPLSMEFSRQEYRSVLPFATPGDLPNPGNKPTSCVSCLGRQILYHLRHLAKLLLPFCLT